MADTLLIDPDFAKSCVGLISELAQEVLADKKDDDGVPCAIVANVLSLLICLFGSASGDTELDAMCAAQWNELNGDEPEAMKAMRDAVNDVMASAQERIAERVAQ